MAKKVNSVFYAQTVKNPEKGGAWLTTVRVTDEGMEQPCCEYTTAWSNASAAKRWIKEKVQELTPRKSVKMNACTTTPPDEKGKPMAFDGTVTFKREV